jgi:hypothetical protein
MIKFTGFVSHINRSLNSCRKTLNEVFYGMTAYDLESELKVVPLYKTWKKYPDGGDV